MAELAQNLRFRKSEALKKSVPRLKDGCTAADTGGSAGAWIHKRPCHEDEGWLWTATADPAFFLKD
jgi:hypothetical protein